MSKILTTPSLETWMNGSIERVRLGLAHYIGNQNHPAPKLQEAMAYSLMNGGKRIRPLLVYATGQLFDAPQDNLDLAAFALEMIHAYSLIHDDLPAMDNADWRRGKLSCHKAYGEDLAILAGDALQTLAFEVIACHPAPLSAENRLAMVQILSNASGHLGMAGGQTLDILNTAQTKATLSENELIQLYQLKTSALLKASVQMGLIAASIKDSAKDAALEKYAENISLAFQIQDDILDIEGQKEHIGKPVGLDKGKVTYPSLVGLNQAKLTLDALLQEALDSLKIFGDKAEMLRALTQHLRKRNK